MEARIPSGPKRILGRFCLRFAPLLESAFDEYYRTHNLPVARLALLSGLLLNVTYGYLDVLLAEQNEAFLLMIRYLVITPFVALILAASYTSFFLRWQQSMLSLAGIVTNGGLCASIAVAFDEVGQFYFFGTIIVNLYGQAFARMLFLPSTAFALTNALVLNGVLLLCLESTTYEFIVTVNYFVVTTLVLGGAVSYSMERALRQDFMQARNLRDTNQQLERNSRTDPLTGLPNRRCLTEELERMIAPSSRTARYSVMLVDIDHFKKINDRYGHDCGDKVLQRFALTLRRMLRGADLLGRWGGEEFLVVLPGTAATGARLAALNLNEAVRKMHIEHEGVVIPVTATFGVSEGSRGEDFDNVLRQADLALYEGKRSGRNTVVVHAEVNEGLRAPAAGTRSTGS